MSILIKGMEMPKNCDKCIYVGWSNFFQIYVCEAIKKEEPVLFNGKQVKSTAIARSGRADNCPLIEVPPHGRLIDADALEVQDGWIRDSKYFAQESSHTHITFVYSEDIYNAPTVIPTDKDGGT